MWQSHPRSGYDAIDNAVKVGSAPGGNVGKLAGPLPRMVAYARLILTQATNLTTSQRYSDGAIAQRSQMTFEVC